MSFRLEDVTVRYPGTDRAALRDVTLRLDPGVHTTIVGPNGAGKSTLLRALLGICRPERGVVRLEDHPIEEWSRRDMARRVALVSAVEEFAFPISVRELVGMGRHPHLGSWRPEREIDRQVVRQALADVDLTDLAGRRVGTLSAGELQRARLARALAQEADHLLLDEPTAHLDLGHEISTFERISELTKQNRFTTITVTHNLNLASRFSDRIVLLSEGRVTAAGDPDLVLVPERIEEAFGCAVEVRQLGDLGLLAVPVRGPDGS